MTKLLDDDIITVARTLAESFLEAPLDPIFGPPPEGSDSRGSRVDVTGAFCGSVVVGCSEGLARRLASQMFGLDADAVTGDDINDATRELANMVAGNLKILMPPPSEIGLPKEVGELSGKDECLINRMSFICAGEPLVISVHETLAPS
jgi:Chemotaxis phosphatase CheX